VTSGGRSRQEWAKLCREWAGSGMSRRAFAGKYGLNPRTFGWWCSRLRHELEDHDDEPQPVGFVELVAAGDRVQEPQPCVSSPSVIVRVGEVVVDFGATLPPAWWVAEVAGRC
jgi:hypothetical protein